MRAGKIRNSVLIKTCEEVYFLMYQTIINWLLLPHKYPHSMFPRKFKSWLFFRFRDKSVVPLLKYTDLLIETPNKDTLTKYCDRTSKFVGSCCLCIMVGPESQAWIVFHFKLLGKWSKWSSDLSNPFQNFESMHWFTFSNFRCLEMFSYSRQACSRNSRF